MILPSRLFEKQYSTPLALAKEAAIRFANDFENPTQKAMFLGYEIRLKTYPQNNSFGFNATFWHIITKGDHLDSVKEIDIERATRVPWILPLIEEGYYDDDVSVYWEDRNNKPRICLFYERMRYVVILEPRWKDSKICYILLWSAYYITPEQRIYKFKRDFRRFKKDFGEFSIDNCPFRKNREAPF